MGLLLAAGSALGAAAAAGRLGLDLGKVATLHIPAALHVEQPALVRRSQSDPAGAFTEAFDLGSDLFAARFNALDGVGANVGNGSRFTRVPRADLDGWGQWKNHVPHRPTCTTAGPRP